MLSLLWELRAVNSETWLLLTFRNNRHWFGETQEEIYRVLMLFNFGRYSHALNRVRALIHGGRWTLILQYYDGLQKDWIFKQLAEGGNSFCSCSKLNG